MPQFASFEMALPAPKCDPGRTRALAAASSSLQAESQPASKTPEARPEFLGRFGEGSRPDVVAADHEIAEVGQRQAAEKRQLGDEPGAARPGLDPWRPAPP